MLHNATTMGKGWQGCRGVVAHRRWPPQTQRLRFNQQGDGCMVQHQQTETMSVSRHLNLKKIVYTVLLYLGLCKCSKMRVKTAIPKGRVISMISFSLFLCIHPSIHPSIHPWSKPLVKLETSWIWPALLYGPIVVPQGQHWINLHWNSHVLPRQASHHRLWTWTWRHALQLLWIIACVNKKHFDSTRCIVVC